MKVSSDRKEFYERYWTQETPPPTDNPTTEERARLLRQTIKWYDAEPGQKRALDAGCGGGGFLEIFVNQGFQAYGIDVAQAAIERAQKRCPTASLHVGSLETSLPFPAQLFDAIWCTEV